jgi:hypothetical protein
VVAGGVGAEAVGAEGLGGAGRGGGGAFFGFLMTRGFTFGGSWRGRGRRAGAAPFGGGPGGPDGDALMMRAAVAVNGLGG